MEISSNLISKSMPCYYSGTHGVDTQFGNSISAFSRVGFRGGDRFLSFSELKLKGRAKVRRNSDCRFDERGHLDYYCNKGSPVCGERKEKGKNKGWNEVSTKKKTKLVKGLVKDLKEFSELGFGLQLDCGEGLIGDVEKTNRISEAAEVLLAQLKQLRAEEDKSEKEKEKWKKQKSKEQDCESSSESSSESSDSECEEVVDMKCFRKESVIQTLENPVVTSITLPNPEGSTSSNQQCCNMIIETTLNDNATIEVLNSEAQNLNLVNSVRSVASSTTITPPTEKRVEVCMGGKCKKSGGLALMDEFQRVVGDEAAVVGCKCMGKCKIGPNVRVSNGDDDSLRTPGNPVITGVGLEDVEMIVANYFGKQKGLGVAIAPLLC